jgi:hypothetical protein
MLPAIYGDSYQIVQAPGYVAVRYEMIHETRIIPLDGTPHASQAIRPHMGDARGHWEGSTLVVETTNLPEPAYQNANTRTLRITERFTRISPDKMDWVVTIEDPTRGPDPGRLPCRSRQTRLSRSSSTRVMKGITPSRIS